MAATATERKLLIDGEWVETGDWVEVRSPYSGDVVGRVAKGGAAEARRAVDAAARALEQPLPAHKRAEILVKVAGLIGRRHEEVARTISDEAGKPIKTARVEASRAMSTYTFAAVEARKLAGEMIPMESAQAGEGKLGFTRAQADRRRRRDLAVQLPVQPRRAQARAGARRRLPRRAEAGVGRRRSRRSCSPSSSSKPGCRRAGSTSLVGPASEIGDVLVEDERVKLITFTGSGDVGWKLQERAPRKRVKLELGNSTPVIVAADADVEAAATKLAANAFAFAGQSCISRAAHLRRARESTTRSWSAFVPKVEALKVGDPADDDTDVGPVIDAGARTRILEWIEEARAGGAKILAGGEENGLIRPTVIAEVADDAKVSCEEVFGPVVDRQPGRLDRRGDRARERHALRPPGRRSSRPRSTPRSTRPTGSSSAASIVNEAPTFRSDQMPYGGVKASGNTKEGPAWAVREMTEERLVVIQR